MWRSDRGTVFGTVSGGSARSGTPSAASFGNEASTAATDDDAVHVCRVVSVEDDTVTMEKTDVVSEGRRPGSTATSAAFAAWLASSGSCWRAPVGAAAAVSMKEVRRVTESHGLVSVAATCATSAANKSMVDDCNSSPGAGPVTL